MHTIHGVVALSIQVPALSGYRATMTGRLLSMNLFSLLQDAAKRWPEDAAVFHRGRSFRYSELYGAAESLALKLLEAGVRPGDKVAVMMPNSPEFIAASLAILRAGGIAVTTPSALKASEIRNLSQEMKLDALCVSTELGSLNRDEVRDSKAVAVFEGRESLCVAVSPNRKTPEHERKALTGVNAATIRFTSGTTAEAKGIILSHETWVERLNAYDPALPPMKDDRILWLSPMATSLVVLYAALLRGSTIILADALDTRQLSSLLQEHRPTEVHGGPLFYRTMLNEEGIQSNDLLEVNHLTSGGSPLPHVVAEAFHNRFDREILQRFSLGECGQVLGNFSEDVRKRGSIGKPARGYEVKLLAEDSNLDGDEVIGELWVRGPGMFDAYYQPWQPRQEVLEDGWFRTGDVARRDADGYYWIVGRTKEVINVGGMKVFPREIEELLLTHPAVEEAMVYGVPEARFGEVPRAKVKLRSGPACTERDLLAYVNERLAFFKALRGIEFVEELPQTATGKTRRWT